MLWDTSVLMVHRSQGFKVCASINSTSISASTPSSRQWLLFCQASAAISWTFRLTLRHTSWMEDCALEPFMLKTVFMSTFVRWCLLWVAFHVPFWSCFLLWFLCGSLFFFALLGAHFLIQGRLHSFLSCSSRIWNTSRCIVSVADIKAVLSNRGVYFPSVRIVGSYASIVSSSPNSFSFNRKTWFFSRRGCILVFSRELIEHLNSCCLHVKRTSSYTLRRIFPSDHCVIAPNIWQRQS